MEMVWPGHRGKRYELLQRTNLVDGGWTSMSNWYGAESNFTARLSIPPQPEVYHSIQVSDLDSDGDGITDWEELTIGLNPRTNRSNRTSNTDSNKVRNAMRATNWVSVAALDAASAKTGRTPACSPSGAPAAWIASLSPSPSAAAPPWAATIRSPPTAASPWSRASVRRGSVDPLMDVLSEGAETSR
jgi:hypothetical protein